MIVHFKEQLTLQSLGWKVEMSGKWQCIFGRAVDPKKIPMKGRISPPKGQFTYHDIVMGLHTWWWNWVIQLSKHKEWSYFTRWWWSPANSDSVFLWLPWQLLPTWIILCIFSETMKCSNNSFFKVNFFVK